MGIHMQTKDILIYVSNIRSTYIILYLQRICGCSFTMFASCLHPRVALSNISPSLLRASSLRVPRFLLQSPISLPLNHFSRVMNLCMSQRLLGTSGAFHPLIDSDDMQQWTHCCNSCHLLLKVWTWLTMVRAHLVVVVVVQEG